MFKNRIKAQVWSRLLSVLLALTMAAGLLGGLAPGAYAYTTYSYDPAYINPDAYSTMHFMLYLNGSAVSYDDPNIGIPGMVDLYNSTVEQNLKNQNPSVVKTVYLNYSADGNYYTGYGYKLSDVLSSFAGLSSTSNITEIKYVGADGFSWTDTTPQTTEFASNLDYWPSGGGSGTPVAPILALYAQSGANQTSLDNYNTIRNFFGESSRTAGSKSDFCKWISQIWVYTGSNGGVVLNKSVDALAKGDSDTLTATPDPSTDTISWTLSDPDNIIQNDSNWPASGYSTTFTTSTTNTGSAVFTATDETLSSHPYSTCTVTVTAPTTSFNLYVGGNFVASVNPASYGITAEQPSYSSYGGAGTYSYYTGYGYNLATLLEDVDPSYFSGGVSIIDEIVFKGSDGYTWDDQYPSTDVFGTLYYFSTPTATGTQVDPIIATLSGGSAGMQYSQLNNADDLRLFVGQQNSGESTKSSLVKWVTEIDVNPQG